MARGRRRRPRDRRLKLLVDTHAALWWLLDDLRLSATARQAIAGAEEPLLSAGTLFEVAIKVSLGKLKVADEWAEELLAEGFGLLPIAPAHAQAYRELPYATVNGKPLRDPFDRLLVAQAETEGILIVTRDPGILAHGPATIW
ncbi:MAG: type II toxin-antitoxin system VapC family toxin [Mycobacteriales bacterium]